MRCWTPQSRERILGRHNIQIARTVQPSKKRFVVNRITGGGNVWTTECALTYDTQPFYTVSIMEFRGVKIAHETHYFAAPFEAGESRRKWVVSMDSPDSRSPLATTESP
jgi:hypothetical protein